MGCCLLGLLFVADYLIPKEAGVPVPIEAATVSNGGSLASWRQSQERHDKLQVSAVVYPDIAPLPPTAERLQWERQMTYRRPDSPALQARAELPATAAEAIAPPTPAKPVAKIPARPRTLARAERHDRPNYAAAYPPAPLSQFSGYRQAQFDRPTGGFFNFRMF
jgi:hypothetical protein